MPELFIFQKNETMFSGMTSTDDFTLYTIAEYCIDHFHTVNSAFRDIVWSLATAIYEGLAYSG
jgi:hypothetical protein